LAQVRVHLPKLHRRALFPTSVAHVRDLWYRWRDRSGSEEKVSPTRLEDEDILCMREIKARLIYLQSLDFEAHHTLDRMARIWKRWGWDAEFWNSEKIVELTAAYLQSGPDYIGPQKVSIIMDTHGRDTDFSNFLRSRAEAVAQWQTKIVDRRPHL
jgi:hypothetical protein